MSHPPTASVQDCWNQVGVWGDVSCPRLDEVAHCHHCPVYSSAAARMLNGAPPADYLAEWAARLAQPPPPAEAALTAAALIFRLGTEWLALPSDVLREVAEPRAIHSLPHRRGRALQGLVNVRGELLICISLAHQLGIHDQLDGTPETGVTHHRVYERLLVVATNAGRLVFPVQEVHGIERYAPAQLLGVPMTLALSSARFTRNLLPWKGRNVACLDENLLFHTLNRNLG